jgi:pimeloyl-ACP methyl ester carboxylesterase
MLYKHTYNRFELMQITSYTPKNLTKFEKPKTHYTAAVLIGVALVAIGICAHQATGARWTRLIGLAGGAVATYGVVRTATRSMLDLCLYPGRIKNSEKQGGYKEWNKWDNASLTKVSIRTDQETVIDARLLKPEGKSNGKVLLLCSGNNMLYERWLPEDFQGALDQGYTICLYNPPSYGKSTGVRTPASDFQAIEGVIRYLTEKEGFEERGIEIQAYSIGSGPACWAASKFGIGTLTLFAPIGTMEGVVERVISNIVSWPIGRQIAAWVTTPVIRAHFNYDNVARLQESRVRGDVEIYDRREDFLMTKGGVSEGLQLQQAVRGPVKLTTLRGDHNDGNFSMDEPACDTKLKTV